MTAPDYELHKLGWRAFQDLGAVVLQEVLGQTFTAFADTNDAGQDGAFHGLWATSEDNPSTEFDEFVKAPMPVVVQCKFSASPSGTLAPSDLDDELAKIELLHARNLCDGYMILTNLRVTGRTHAWFTEEVRKRGPQAATILPGTWICTQIAKNWNLRRYVPRVYGLGDLTSILDERRIRQARALLTSLTRELETFVPTGAYRGASDAITDHGFVLLLGEPASGKSTIAAMLCMTALDNWKCDVMRVDGPDELLSHWNPDDPRQMFWIDDAFGSIRHEPYLTGAWVRRMPEVMAAVNHGARVLMTSRDYIYREARPAMKEYAFPRLREQQVVINITDLSVSEKQQMLYNHLKAGDQSATVLNNWRPHLRAVAATERFQPEIARRLSLRDFVPTTGLRDEAALVSYFEHPNEFLVDVLEGLNPPLRAALAAIYLSGGELLAPFIPDERLTAAVTALGVTVPETARAFSTIEGTFISQNTMADGNTVWRFHHPTIREGFAASVARDISTLPVYLEGMTSDELVSQIDCGGRDQQGTLVQVPPSLYSLVAPRVPTPDRRDVTGGVRALFLRTRCSDEFLRRWALVHEDTLPGLARFGMLLSVVWEPALLSRLKEAGALPEDIRRRAVELVVEYSVDDLDPGWADPSVSALFTEEEHADLRKRVEEEVLPELLQRIDDYASSYRGNDMTNEELYETPRDYVDAIRGAFPDRPDVLKYCAQAENHINNREYDDGYDYKDERSSATSGLAAPARPATTDAYTARDPFDDVASGH